MPAMMRSLRKKRGGVLAPVSSSAANSGIGPSSSVPKALPAQHPPQMASGTSTELHRRILAQDWDGLRGLLLPLLPPLQRRLPEHGDGGGIGPSTPADVDCDVPSLPSQENAGAVAPNRVRGGRRTGLRKPRPPPPPPSAASSASLRAGDLLSRDGKGRTPLHLVLLRYRAPEEVEGDGSLRPRLRLRRAPPAVVLAVLQAGPGAAAVADRGGRIPLHVAAAEGHGGEVVEALLAACPPPSGVVGEGEGEGGGRGGGGGGASSSSSSSSVPDGTGRTALDHSLEYAFQNASRKDDGGGATDPRWTPVLALLRATPPAAVAACAESRGGGGIPVRPPPLLEALARSAPAEVVRGLLLSPPAGAGGGGGGGGGEGGGGGGERGGDGPAAAAAAAAAMEDADACAALYLAVQGRYPVPLLKELAGACPAGAGAVRDETGMGLVAATYVVRAYSGDRGDVGAPPDAPRHWSDLTDHGAMVKSVEGEVAASSSSSSSSSPPPLPAEFAEWWPRAEFWIRRHGGPGSGGGGRDGEPLLHLALRNPDVPPQVIHMILRLHPGQARARSLPPSAAGGGGRLPLHEAVVTPTYTPRHYERKNFVPHSTVHLLCAAHPPSPRAFDPGTGRLPLHAALWEGRKVWEEGVAVLAGLEPRALRVRDRSRRPHAAGACEGAGAGEADPEPSGLRPFQIAAVGRIPTGEERVRWANVARNRCTNTEWRALDDLQRAAAVARTESLHRLRELETVYLLLRADPGAIAGSARRPRGRVRVRVRAAEGGGNVGKLASRWGARSKAHIQKMSGVPVPKAAAAPSVAPVPPVPEEQPEEEELDLFGEGFSPHIFHSNSEETASSPTGDQDLQEGLQFLVEGGRAVVTSMTPKLNAEPTGEQKQLNDETGPNGKGEFTPQSPEAIMPEAAPFLSPDWTALGSPRSKSDDLSADSSMSSTDAIPIGFTDIHKLAQEADKKKLCFKKGSRPSSTKSPQMSSRTSTKGISAASSPNMPLAHGSNSTPSKLNLSLSDDDWNVSPSPSSREAETAQRSRIYDNWMHSYGVDQPFYEFSRMLTNTTAHAGPGAKSTRHNKNEDGNTGERNILILPCKHVCPESSCLNGNQSTCPVCHQTIFSTLEVFL